MANDLTNKKPTMSAILASNGIKEKHSCLTQTKILENGYCVMFFM